jgi:hypothetical protein
VVLGDLQQRVLLEERVVLDLVGEHGAVLERAAQVPGGEVAHAEAADLALVLQRGERADRLLDRDIGRRPVQQQEVQVVGVEPTQRVLGRLAHARGARHVRRHLRREPDVLAGHARVGDPLAHLALVLVPARGVDVAVADLERVAHALAAVVAGQAEGAEAELGQLDPLDRDGLGSGVDARHGIVSTRRPNERTVP